MDPFIATLGHYVLAALSVCLVLCAGSITIRFLQR